MQMGGADRAVEWTDELNSLLNQCVFECGYDFQVACQLFKTRSQALIKSSVGLEFVTESICQKQWMVLNPMDDDEEEYDDNEEEEQGQYHQSAREPATTTRPQEKEIPEIPSYQHQSQHGKVLETLDAELVQHTEEEEEEDNVSSAIKRSTCLELAFSEEDLDLILSQLPTKAKATKAQRVEQVGDDKGQEEEEEETSEMQWVLSFLNNPEEAARSDPEAKSYFDKNRFDSGESDLMKSDSNYQFFLQELDHAAQFFHDPKAMEALSPVRPPRQEDDEGGQRSPRHFRRQGQEQEEEEEEDSDLMTVNANMAKRLEQFEILQKKHEEIAKHKAKLQQEKLQQHQQQLQKKKTTDTLSDSDDFNLSNEEIDDDDAEDWRSTRDAIKKGIATPAKGRTMPATSSEAQEENHLQQVSKRIGELLQKNGSFCFTNGILKPQQHQEVMVKEAFIVPEVPTTSSSVRCLPPAPTGTSVSVATTPSVITSTVAEQEENETMRRKLIETALRNYSSHLGTSSTTTSTPSLSSGSILFDRSVSCEDSFVPALPLELWNQVFPYSLGTEKPQQPLIQLEDSVVVQVFDLEHLSSPQLLGKFLDQLVAIGSEHLYGISMTVVHMKQDFKVPSLLPLTSCSHRVIYIAMSLKGQKILEQKLDEKALKGHLHTVDGCTDANGQVYSSIHLFTRVPAFEPKMVSNSPSASVGIMPQIETGVCWLDVDRIEEHTAAIETFFETMDQQNELDLVGCRLVFQEKSGQGRMAFAFRGPRANEILQKSTYVQCPPQRMDSHKSLVQYFGGRVLNENLYTESKTLPRSHPVYLIVYPVVEQVSIRVPISPDLYQEALSIFHVQAFQLISFRTESPAFLEVVAQKENATVRMENLVEKLKTQLKCYAITWEIFVPIDNSSPTGVLSSFSSSLPNLPLSPPPQLRIDFDRDQTIIAVVPVASFLKESSSSQYNYQSQQSRAHDILSSTTLLGLKTFVADASTHWIIEQLNAGTAKCRPLDCSKFTTPTGTHLVLMVLRTHVTQASFVKFYETLLGRDQMVLFTHPHVVLSVLYHVFTSAELIVARSSTRDTYFTTHQELQLQVKRLVDSKIKSQEYCQALVDHLFLEEKNYQATKNQLALVTLKPMETMRKMVETFHLLLRRLHREEFQWVDLKMTRLRPDQVDILYGHDQQRHVQYLCDPSKTPCIVICIRRINAISRLHDLLGPEDPESARRTANVSLRAACGQDMIQNGFYSSVSLDDTVRDLELFFGLKGTQEYEDQCQGMEHYTRTSSSVDGHKDRFVLWTPKTLVETICIVLTGSLVNEFTSLVSKFQLEGFQLVNLRTIHFGKCLEIAEQYMSIHKRLLHELDQSQTSAVMAWERDSAISRMERLRKDLGLDRGFYMSTTKDQAQNELALFFDEFYASVHRIACCKDEVISVAEESVRGEEKEE